MVRTNLSGLVFGAWPRAMMDIRAQLAFLIEQASEGASQIIRSQLRRVTLSILNFRLANLGRKCFWGFAL